MHLPDNFSAILEQNFKPAEVKAILEFTNNPSAYPNDTLEVSSDGNTIKIEHNGLVLLRNVKRSKDIPLKYYGTINIQDWDNYVLAENETHRKITYLITDSGSLIKDIYAKHSGIFVHQVYNKTTQSNILCLNSNKKQLDRAKKPEELLNALVEGSGSKCPHLHKANMENVKNIIRGLEDDHKQFDLWFNNDFTIGEKGAPIHIIQDYKFRAAKVIHPNNLITIHANNVSCKELNLLSGEENAPYAGRKNIVI